jgi:hypothetical protein
LVLVEKPLSEVGKLALKLVGGPKELLDWKLAMELEKEPEAEEK